MGQRFYVIAGKHSQAIDLARRYKIPFRDVHYVSDTRDLRGIRGYGMPIYIYGTYYANRNSRELLAMAEERGFKLEFVIDSQKPNIALDTLDKSVQD